MPISQSYAKVDMVFFDRVIKYIQDKLKTFKPIKNEKDAPI